MKFTIGLPTEEICLKVSSKIKGNKNLTISCGISFVFNVKL